MELTRNLRRGMSGEDVLAVKQRLLEVGAYKGVVTEFKKPLFFGDQTRDAVVFYQSSNGLKPDGIVGILTWTALFGAPAPVEIADVVGIESLDRFGAAIKNGITAEWAGLSKARIGMCLDALQFPVDPENPGGYPRSLYIRGGNLYNTDLTPNVITVARIRSGATRQPEYYDGGRREMMERAVALNPLITGADCSGGVVGLQRHAGVVQPGFDLAADGFAASSSYAKIKASEMLPGDLPHKPGHIGMYVGGGYAVEWVGGAYGCQLTKINKRRVWNYVSNRYANMGAWVNFLHAKRY